MSAVRHLSGPIGWLAPSFITRSISAAPAHPIRSSIQSGATERQHRGSSARAATMVQHSPSSWPARRRQHKCKSRSTGAVAAQQWGCSSGAPGLATLSNKANAASLTIGTRILLQTNLRHQHTRQCTTTPFIALPHQHTALHVNTVSHTIHCTITMHTIHCTITPSHCIWSH